MDRNHLEKVKKWLSETRAGQDHGHHRGNHEDQRAPRVDPSSRTMGIMGTNMGTLGRTMGTQRGPLWVPRKDHGDHHGHLGQDHGHLGWDHGQGMEQKLQGRAKSLPPLRSTTGARPIP